MHALLESVMDDMCTVHSGGYRCPKTGVAVLYCIPPYGHKRTDSYKWFVSGKEMRGEQQPVVYTEETGTFTCTITSGTIIRGDTQTISMKGKYVCYQHNCPRTSV